MSENKEEILIVGSGYMGIEYAKVIKKMGYPYIVVSRGEANAVKFEKEMNVEVIRGGIENWLKKNKKLPKIAIVCVSGNNLGKVSKKLIEYGVNRILLEKPGGIDIEEIGELSKISQIKKIDILLAYNRRFYGSVKKAQEIIKKDHGISSMTFEFTEWSHTIRDLIQPPGIKENWLYHNSSHVLDLAFYLGGFPKEMKSYKKGSLEWHPKGSCFVGSGITEKDVLFSYHANWAAPGRWGLEINTNKHRLIFRPLEKLKVTKLGKVSIEDVEFDETLDLEFKTGLYNEVKSYLNEDYSHLSNIQEQEKNMKIYKLILEGGSI